MIFQLLGQSFAQTKNGTYLIYFYSIIVSWSNSTINTLNINQALSFNCPCPL